MIQVPLTFTAKLIVGASEAWWEFTSTREMPAFPPVGSTIELFPGGPYANVAAVRQPCSGGSLYVLSQMTINQTYFDKLTAFGWDAVGVLPGREKMGA